jgi:hypothetical protein
MLRRGNTCLKHPGECALKQQEIVNRPAARAISSKESTAESAERRRGRRFAVSASAEMVELRTHTQLAGRASDLGTGGCYVDTLTPFPVETSLILNLKSENHVVRAKADVIYAHTGMGMGLAFTGMDSDQRENLSAWLRELSGDTPKEQPAYKVNRADDLDVAGRAPGVSTNSANLFDMLEDLLSLLRNRGMLSEAEVESLREKMGR